MCYYIATRLFWRVIDIEKKTYVTWLLPVNENTIYYNRTMINNICLIYKSFTSASELL